MINGVSHEHVFVTRQLNTRKAGENQVLVTRPINEDSNTLARYLERYGTEHYTRMTVFNGPFDRVRKIWRHDMELDFDDVQFQVIYKDNLVEKAVEEVVINEVHEEDVEM